eukprot:m51a1_g11691 hypothetical protein (1611) ;mRNA; f:855-7284
MPVAQAQTVVTLTGFSLVNTSRPLGQARARVRVAAGARSSASPLRTPGQSGAYAFGSFSAAVDTAAAEAVVLRVEDESGAPVAECRLPVGALSGSRAAAALHCGTLAFGVERPRAAQRGYEAPAGRARALVIGINDYPPPNRLGGCENDTATVRTWLAHLGVPRESTTTLLSAEATQSAVVREIGKLVAGAAKGDLLVLTYSGHGTLVSVGGVETAAMCPVDCDDHWDDPQLTSEGLGKMLMPAAQAGATVVLYMDCCHSGTMGTTGRLYARNDGRDIRPRFMPAPGSDRRPGSSRAARGLHRINDFQSAFGVINKALRGAARPGPALLPLPLPRGRGGPGAEARAAAKELPAGGGGRQMAFGSVMDILRVGVQRGCQGRQGDGHGRPPVCSAEWVDIVAGTSMLAPGVMEAAGATSSSSNSGPGEAEGPRGDRGLAAGGQPSLSEGQHRALRAMSTAQWQAALCRAVRANPGKMAGIIDAVVGLDADPARQRAAISDISDSGWIASIADRLRDTSAPRELIARETSRVLQRDVRLYSMGPDQQRKLLRSLDYAGLVDLFAALQRAQRAHSHSTTRAAATATGSSPGGRAEAEAEAEAEAAGAAEAAEQQQQREEAALASQRGWISFLGKLLLAAAPAAITAIGSAVAGRGLCGGELQHECELAVALSTAEAVSRIAEAGRDRQWGAGLAEAVRGAIRASSAPPAPAGATSGGGGGATEAAGAAGGLGEEMARAARARPAEFRRSLVDSVVSFAQERGLVQEFSGAVSAVAAGAGGSAGGAAASSKGATAVALTRDLLRGWADIVCPLLDAASHIIGSAAATRGAGAAAAAPGTAAAAEAATAEARHAMNAGLSRAIAESDDTWDAVKAALQAKGLEGGRSSGAIGKALDLMDDAEIAQVVRAAAKSPWAKDLAGSMERELEERLGRACRDAPGVAARALVAAQCGARGGDAEAQATQLCRALYAASNRVWRNMLAKAFGSPAGGDAGGGGSSGSGNKAPVRECGTEFEWPDVLEELAGSGGRELGQVLPQLGVVLGRSVDRSEVVEIKDGRDVLNRRRFAAVAREVTNSVFREVVVAAAHACPSVVMPLLAQARGPEYDMVADAIGAVESATHCQVMEMACTALAEDPDSIARFLPGGSVPWGARAEAAAAASGTRGFVKEATRGIKAASFSGVHREAGSNGGLILMAACQIDQTAADAAFEGGKREGAFTHYVNEVLVRDCFSANQDLTYKELMASAARALRAFNYKQRPNFVPQSLAANSFLRVLSIAPESLLPAPPVSAKPVQQQPPETTEVLTSSEKSAARAKESPAAPDGQSAPRPPCCWQGSTMYQWDSQASLREVFLERRVRGRLEDNEIAVYEDVHADTAAASGVTWLPHCSIDDIDKIHVYATVRGVLDMYQRHLQLPQPVYQAGRASAGNEQQREQCSCEMHSASREGHGGAKDLAGLLWSYGGGPAKLLINVHSPGLCLPYYSKGEAALHFPYFSTPASKGVPMATCRSADVVAHTAAYAILDVLKPSWSRVREYPWAAVYHESFADLTALLSVLTQPAVCSSLVAQSRGDISAAHLLAHSGITPSDSLNISALRSASRPLECYVQLGHICQKDLPDR